MSNKEPDKDLLKRARKFKFCRSHKPSDFCDYAIEKLASFAQGVRDEERKWVKYAKGEKKEFEDGALKELEKERQLRKELEEKLKEEQK